MNRKKILYIITKSNWGGAQRYVFDLATNLSKTKFETAVALGGDGELKNKLEESGIRTIKIERLNRDIQITDEVFVFLKLLKLIKHETPNVIHLNSSKIGVLGALSARLYNLYVFFFKLLRPKSSILYPTKIVFTAHGWAFKEERSVWQRLLIKGLSWLTILLSTTTIVVSEDDKNKVRGLIWVARKIKIIHNGIKPIEFKLKDEARKILQPNSKPDEKTLLLGVVAELHKNKGLVYAIEGYAEFTKKNPEIKSRLIILGDGEEKDILETLIKKLKLEKNILLAGRIENVSILLKAFDIFLVSSIKEGLPYGLLEAGQAGLPTIATCVGGIPEIITDMKSGILVRPKNFLEISKALELLISNEPKRREFGVQIANKVSTEFTLEKMLLETEALCDN